MAKNKLSYSQRQDLIRAALRPNPGPDTPYVWIRDLFDDEVVFEVGNKTYKATYSIDAKNVVTLGASEEVLARTVYETVKISEASVAFAKEEGDMVVHSGKLFELGSYEFPFGTFALTEEEADAWIAENPTVDNELEHFDTKGMKNPLSGKLGKTYGFSRVGKEIFGSVSVPKPLKEILGEGAIKTSLAFDPVTKKPLRNGLVTTPRIADAAVFSLTGQPIANDDPAPERAKGGKMPKLTLAGLAALFGIGNIREADPDQEIEVPATFAKPAGTPAETPETIALKARLAALEDQRIQEHAVAFAREMVADKRILPAEQEAIAAMFAQAVRDDNAGAACFSAEGALQEGARIQRLRSLIKARPQHRLTEELVGAKPEELSVVFSGAPQGKPLINHSEIYADRAKAARG